MHLFNKKILLGVTGGIAAYKTPDLVRKLKAQGADVRVVLTRGATEFVSSLSLQAVSGHQVHSELLDEQAEAGMGHIELAKWADVLLIAPATAHCMAKLAHGLADDLLSTLYLATTAQVFIAPAMNQQMWQARATQDNLQKLQLRAIRFIGPAAGEQACGDVGPGRMEEPELIVSALASALTGNKLEGKKVVITAGPTREPIDPVRYLSNHSSGKMGYAVAQAAAEQGAEVVLVSGPVSLTVPPGIKRISVQTADDMLEAVMSEINSAQIFIAAAAVADYRINHQAENKIKKSDDELTLTFVKNPDILKTVAALPSPPFTVGFAAESQNVEAYARGKLENKNLDMIAANDITLEGLGFNSDENALHVIWKEDDVQLPPANKTELAKSLIALVAKQYNNKQSN